MDSEDENVVVANRSNDETQQHKIDSESEFEHDFLLEPDIEQSRLRRGIANLKSKVKAKQQQQQNPTQSSEPVQQAVVYSASSHTVKTVKKDKSPVRLASGSVIRNAFLGKKRKPPVQLGDIASPTTALSSAMGLRKRTGIELGKKNIEIETGVEMLEDMIPLGSSSTIDAKEFEFPLQTEVESRARLLAGEDLAKTPQIVDYINPKNSLNRAQLATSTLLPQRFNSIILRLQHFPYIIFICIIIVLWLPMREFIRGVLICLLGIALFDRLWTFLQECIAYYFIQTPPEKNKFQIPDYSKLPIVEIPAAEEHKTVKTYAGWMNEASTYDPNTFHISMTRTIYVRLEGSILHLLSTQARIPKRTMWNEVPIDRKTITFTDKRSFNLMGCRIELLPLGLARKRYFNRKYPIQLIVKKCIRTQSSSKRPSTSSKDESIFQDARSTSTLSTTNGNAASTDENLNDMENNSEIDFAHTILNTDLAVWQENINPDMELTDMTIPCGDEVRLLLFSRTDREKEDWYRRFVAASLGEVHDRELNIPNIHFVDDKEIQLAAEKISNLQAKYKDEKVNEVSTKESTAKESLTKESFSKESNTSDLSKVEKRSSLAKTPDDDFDELDEEIDIEMQTGHSIDGLLMTWCAARNPTDYVRFMALYQQACNQTHIPVYKKTDDEIFVSRHHKKHHRRVQRKKDELWKGIDQSLFLGPSGSVVWANVLIGRIVFSCLHDQVVHAKVQELLQKKLTSVRLPSFMEDVVITQINLGKTPPLIHRVSQPMLDERGLWVDADVTYEGLLQITVTTKLNLLRLKKQARPVPFVDLATTSAAASSVATQNINPAGTTTAADTPTTSHWFPVATTEETTNNETNTPDDVSNNAIYDSDAESSGGSSSESDSTGTNVVNAEAVNAEFNVFNTSPGNARRIFKIVDRITASNFFQYATELSYVQRAMENMNANITLRIDLKGLVARAVINIPPPPSDRIWLSFRGPPRLWITAKPAVGDKSMDWSIVTNVIESKLCELVNKHLVYPNMVDFTIPVLGHPNYNKYNPE